jgi:hypothetical protein
MKLLIENLSKTGSLSTVFFDALYGGGLLSLAFLILSGVQWFWVVRGWMGGKPKSLIPFVGGILGCLGIFLSGVPGSISFCWLPFIIDPGSIWMIGTAIRKTANKE